MIAHSSTQQTIVVIGNGMVGHRFCENLVELDTPRNFRIVTFCEEPRAAYDRVGLTSFFAHRDAEKLMLARLDWYREQGIELHLGDRATRIDRVKRTVYSENGKRLQYDAIVLATGSYPFVPDVPGIQHRGVFVYRTIEDLERILAYAQHVKRCAVIGGGLLGLEAAKAAYDLGLETHVVEFAPRLMPRQLDDAGSKALISKIEALGVTVHLNKSTKEVQGDGSVEAIVFNDDQDLPVEMIIVSAGIRPRDDLARDCKLDVGQRGGVVVNDALRTSDPAIFAIGEVALHNGMIYGLVAPGYEMAEVVAANLTGGQRRFTGADLSTKLKLMGVDVASFGQYEAPPDVAVPMIYDDPFRGLYRKLLFDRDGTKLLGGVLVGDAADYGMLLAMCRANDPLPCAAGDLVAPSSSTAAAAIGGSLPDSAQICSCNNVTKGQICQAIREQDANTIGELKACTKAGTGCGGCVPMVTDLLKKELAAAGKLVVNHLCEHFAYSRQELFQIVKIKQIRSFDKLLAGHGRGAGCEVCKPAAASIFASLWNDHILDAPLQTLQDTNDRFLANMQRGGLYSIVPRVPGGEITPDGLIAMGRIAKKYGLYTKITGGQRIDLFGAQVHQLPDIWEELIAAGFESGHAYGKAVRTVKSCVGTTWCRYGVQDSVAFAIRVEKRYRGIRAPHKLKAAVSGCIRECAEAQSKDFGLIATEKGYNLYVCGNGGSKPRHADLLAADLDEATALRYIDRFLMYYIQTADRLTRTSVWLENMPGGIDYLRDVVIHDKLGIGDELERQMEHLVETYRCEWTEVVNDPTRRGLFRQFINSEETETGIEIITERGQNRPADWRRDSELVQLQPLTDARRAVGVSPRRAPGAICQLVPQRQAPPGADASGSPAELSSHRGKPRSSPPPAQSQWVRIGSITDFPLEGGAAIKYGKVQIAVFHFASRGQWFASQNMCPHKRAFVLSRGILGTHGDVPKVACPLHKNTFSLESGECLSGDEHALKVFPVKVTDDDVYLLLPPQGQLDALLGTELHCVTACESSRHTSCAVAEPALG